MGKLRFYIPNAVTSMGIVFAALSMRSAVDGHYRSAAWWGLYCLLTDKIDGAIARRLKASSAFGAELDSFADFMSFGVAPAVLFYSFFSTMQSAGWADPTSRSILLALCTFHLICVAARLARFNVTHDVHGAGGFFFGWPTTYNGGMLLCMFVLALKYGDPAWTATDPADDRLMIFGGLRMDAFMRILPWLLLPAGITMVSTLRMPKVNGTGIRWLDVLMYLNMAAGYTCGLFHRVPEYLMFGGLIFTTVAIRYHFVAKHARAIELPPLFPDDPREHGEAVGGEVRKAG